MGLLSDWNMKHEQSYMSSLPGSGFPLLVLTNVCLNLFKLEEFLKTLGVPSYSSFYNEENLFDKAPLKTIHSDFEEMFLDWRA